MRLRVALAQINPRTGDLEGNLRRILEAIERARGEGVELAVFPEMCLTGYCLDEKLLINSAFLRENRRLLLEEVVPATQGIAAVVGFVDYDESRTGPDRRLIRYNAAAVIEDGRLLQRVYKRLLPAYRYFDDKRYFEPGREVEPVSVMGSSIGVLICEDLWDDDYELKPSEIYRQKGAEILFCINASPFVGSSPGERDGKRFRREAMIRRQIDKLGIPIVYVNTVGVGDNGKNIIPFDGFSQAFDRSGRRVLCLPQFEPAFGTVDFEKGEAAPVEDPGFDREEEIYRALAMSIRDYYDKLGIFEKVLVAVSGGIDSALGAALACEAMGPDRVALYNLPSRFNSPTTRELARRLAENFKLEYHVVPIQDIVDRVVEEFEHHLRPIRRPVTLENLQARIRGLLMMAECNDLNALLLTNGNETEIALGYATLYGDMVGGLSAIGDLPKTDVYRLARYVNRRWQREMIPVGSFEIAASAELRADQVDPFDYPVVAPLVNDFIELGLGPEEMMGRFEGRELRPQKYPADLYERYAPDRFEELARDLYRSLSRSVYKRLQGAPIVVVSERAFGFDLRETIINAWEGHRVPVIGAQ